VDEQKAKVRTFLAKHLRNHDLSDEADIFGLGFVNSLFAMQLVMFVEREFGITIENEDLDIENFRTVNAIVKLVEKKAATLAEA
jgi:acyl carrier protein